MLKARGIKREFRLSVIPCVIAAFLVAGCATIKLYPKSNQGVLERDNRLTITQNKVSLTILTNTWNYTPSELDDYYTPLEVIIRNDQEHSIETGYSDFLLFDEFGNQYRALNPGAVDNSLGYQGYGRRYGRYTAFFGFSYGRFGHPLFYDPFYYPFWYGYPNYSSAVQRVGLLQGAVRPHAQVSGFLYFQKILPESKDLVLEWIVDDPTAITPTIITIKLGVTRSRGLRG